MDIIIVSQFFFLLMSLFFFLEKKLFAVLNFLLFPESFCCLSCLLLTVFSLCLSLSLTLSLGLIYIKVSTDKTLSVVMIGCLFPVGEPPCAMLLELLRVEVRRAWFQGFSSHISALLLMSLLLNLRSHLSVLILTGGGIKLCSLSQAREVGMGGMLV